MVLLCLLPLGFAAAEETADEEEPTRYLFDCDMDTFNERFQAIFKAMNNTYEMAEEPNIENAYEYHLPANVYAKVLTHEGKIEYILLFLNRENSENQQWLWQFGAIMAASVGDMPASVWAELLMLATNLQLDTDTAHMACFVGGNLMMICQSDPDNDLLFVLLEREENERNEPMDGSFQTGSLPSAVSLPL